MNGPSQPKVLAFLDNSAAAHPVLAAAHAVAPVLGATVEAVHVLNDSDGTALTTSESFDIPLRTLQGDPAEQLIAASTEAGVVAAVVGARALPGRRPAGHLALWLADHAETPVLVVPPDAQLTDRVRRVLIAMEGAPSNARTLKHTIALARNVGFELIVVHVDDADTIPMFSDQPVYEAEAYAKEFLARYVPGAPDARLELRFGVPVDEILNVADESAPDVIAIGWRQSDDRTRGAVAHELLARSHIPLFLVAVQS